MRQTAQQAGYRCRHPFSTPGKTITEQNQEQRQRHGKRRIEEKRSRENQQCQAGRQHIPAAEQVAHFRKKDHQRCQQRQVAHQEEGYQRMNSKEGQGPGQQRIQRPKGADAGRGCVALGQQQVVETAVPAHPDAK